jgi:hypothetical protein
MKTYFMSSPHFPDKQKQANISELLCYGYISELVHSAVNSSHPNTHDDYISPFLGDFPHFEKKKKLKIQLI